MINVKAKDPGDCYCRAFNCCCDYDGSHNVIRKMFNLPGHRMLSTLLVHGFPTGTAGEAEGKMIGHAWVEVRIAGMNWCIDFHGSDLVNIPKVVYYRIGKIDESLCEKFTPDEAREMVLKHRVYTHWGKQIPKEAHFAV